MDRHEVLAEALWSHVNKGPLLTEYGAFLPGKGQSKEQATLYAVACAVARPKQYRLPCLDEINQLPAHWRIRVLQTLAHALDLTIE